jgi:hypothetical protein
MPEVLSSLGLAFSAGVAVFLGRTADDAKPPNPAVDPNEKGLVSANMPGLPLPRYLERLFVMGESASENPPL